MDISISTTFDTCVYRLECQPAWAGVRLPAGPAGQSCSVPPLAAATLQYGACSPGVLQPAGQGVPHPACRPPSALPAQALNTNIHTFLARQILSTRRCSNLATDVTACSPARPSRGGRPGSSATAGGPTPSAWTRPRCQVCRTARDSHENNLPIVLILYIVYNARTGDQSD